MLFEIVGLVVVAVLLSICLWGLYNVPILATGVQDFRKSRQKPQKKLFSDKPLPSFSIVVPAKDEANVIGRLLDALSALNYPVEKREIVIVEDGSTDGTLDVCMKYAREHAGVKVLHRSFSTGKPSALNFGLEHATGDIIAIFDADSVPAPDVLTAVCKYFDEPVVAAVQGKTLSINSKENMLTQFISYEEAVWCEAYLRGKDVLNLFVHLKGSCQFIRRNVLEKLQGFSEAVLSEDMELSARLTENNYKIRYASDVAAWQESPSNFKTLFRQRIRWFRGTMEVALKYGRLIAKPSRKNFDAETTLFGPFILIASLLPYTAIFWAFFTVFPIDVLWRVAVQFASLTTLLTLFACGLALIYITKPRKMKNILWLPFIYLYWVLQAFIALYAAVLILLRRPQRWTKTEKKGLVTSILLSGDSSSERKRGLSVCFVSSYPPNHARLSEYAKNLVNEMARSQIVNDIHVLADMVGGSKNSAQEGSNIEVLRIWKPDDPFSILGILPKILRLKPDIVHFNVHFQSFGKNRASNFVGLSLIFLCRILNVKVVATLHNLGELVDLTKFRMKSTFLNRAGILVATRLVLSASTVVVKVKTYKNYLCEHYGCEEVSYIPHGAAVKIDPPHSSKEKVVLIFGHMGPHKGLQVLLNAFKEIIKVRKDVKLVIAGSDHPNFAGYLESVKRDNSLSKVDFLGYVGENDLTEVFEAADVVVLPYLTATGTSGVFHLACGFGKAIIASDLPEIRELMAEGASAIIVPPGEVKMLKDAILLVLDDRALRASMERQNLMFAQKENWGIIAEAYEKVYLAVS